MRSTPGSTDDETTTIELRLLLEAIQLRYHYDFRGYSPEALLRRLQQAQDRFECRSLSVMQERLLRDPALFRALLTYLTVQVSDLFRDPTFYRALRERVVPCLRQWPAPRLWVAGCSTGEEVWSLAIVLREEGLLDRCRIYATDINPDALEQARTGIYPLDRIARFSEAYLAAGGTGSLADHYTTGYEAALFDRRLLKPVHFSHHNLATDPAFAEVQSITCRNVLIHFERPLREQVLRLLTDSLQSGGFLGLGSKETIEFTAGAAAYEPFVREERIWRKK